jgi:DNA-binding Lrp family transcriptional regulator
MAKNKEIVTAIKQLKGLKSVDIVTGPYDVIAVIEADTLDEVGSIVTGKIHTIPGISRTVTCLSI